jgi:hypothetical protein
MPQCKFSVFVPSTPVTGILCRARICQKLSKLSETRFSGSGLAVCDEACIQKNSALARGCKEAAGLFFAVCSQHTEIPKRKQVQRSSKKSRKF